MKKFYLFLLILLFAANLAVAQNPGAKWLNVLDSNDQSVYIDTTNIKQADNQITIVSLFQYKTPRMIPAYKKEAKSVKNQILFNLASDKYTILGSLFYDEKLKIIGESSLPGFSLGNETFATSVDSNKIMDVLYKKSIELLNIDTSLIVKAEKPSNNILPLIDSQKEPGTNNVVTNNIDNEATANISKNEKIVDRNKFVDKSPQQKTTIANKTANQNSTQNIQSKSAEYNSSAETNPKGTIFTDGSKYCFQVSSWRIKSRAENEVAMLKKKGYNAFITEAYIPSKGGTWYRVRIGFFNSVTEAESYKRQIQ